MILSGNYGPIGWRSSKGAHSVFRPKGRMLYAGRSPTRRADMAMGVTGDASLQARIIVGFNVAGKPKWTLRDVQNIVLAEKHKAGLGAGASFLMQYGIYQEKRGDKVDRERSAQIILLNLFDGLPQRAFIAHVRKIARALRIRLQQDAVLVQVTRLGRVVRGGEWQERRPPSRAT
jgi:hypothetical protein